MKVKEVLDYIREGEEVKLIIKGDRVDLVMEGILDNFPAWAGELDVLSIKVVDGMLCIEVSIAPGKILDVVWTEESE